MRAPQRFEVVQLFSPLAEDKLLIKRIIGLPGEKIIFKRNSVYIKKFDGIEQQVIEPYLSNEISTRVEYGASSEIYIPENSYFVLGDNRFQSIDSREYGPVARQIITGRAVPLFWK